MNASIHHGGATQDESWVEDVARAMFIQRTRDCIEATEAQIERIAYECLDSASLYVQSCKARFALK